VVLYWDGESPALSFWSRGEDVTLGGILASQARLKDRSSGLTATLAPLGELEWALKGLREAAGSDVEWQTSADGREATATVRKRGKMQKLSSGVHFREDSVEIFAFSNGRLVSENAFLEVAVLDKGGEVRRQLQSEITFAEYDQNYPLIPRRVWRSLHPQGLLNASEFVIRNIEPIPPTLTASEVLRDLTQGLSQNQWPARRSAQKSWWQTVTAIFGPNDFRGWPLRAGIVVVAVAIAGFWMWRSKRKIG